ncbi:MAG: 50S ribosomal protein L10 [Ignavibacteriae bacterium HGW-Ignavibacteriae-2]|jgi:large subunit ribosomal protein L10|nr:50S ribosomal protein L10 [Bacteroidota bacterium]PKL89081.1 MAG: 50S ribosomal protein L10 [Ignavibacteriae bacterium HGW-Ignavibacteriae-2]
MNRTEKADVIAEIKENFENSTAVYLVDYQGITVEEINGLRKLFRNEGVKYKIYKNTFISKAIEETGTHGELSNLLVGMTGIIFAGENNFAAPAKIIQKFSDEKKKFSFKGCYIESSFYDKDQLKTLASLPSKEEVMASIIGSIHNPISGVVGAIGAVMRDIVVLVDEISKKKAA